MLSPQTTIEAVESWGLKLARLIEIPPYHDAAVFKLPLTLYQPCETLTLPAFCRGGIARGVGGAAASVARLRATSVARLRVTRRKRLIPAPS